MWGVVGGTSTCTSAATTSSTVLACARMADLENFFIRRRMGPRSQWTGLVLGFPPHRSAGMQQEERKPRDCPAYSPHFWAMPTATASRRTASMANTHNDVGTLLITRTEADNSNDDSQMAHLQNAQNIHEGQIAMPTSLVDCELQRNFARQSVQGRSGKHPAMQ